MIIHAPFKKQQQQQQKQGRMPLPIVSQIPSQILGLGLLASPGAGKNGRRRLVSTVRTCAAPIKLLVVILLV